MSEQEPTSEARGRRLGEALGQQVGGLLGRRLGEALVAGVGAAKPGSDATVGSPVGDEDATADEDRADEDQGDETGGQDASGDENGEGTEAAEESGRPSSRAELDELSYRELQKLAKEVDVTANLKREEMEDRLVETLDIAE
ncbi:hypothetical protein [Halococcus agarilyticus]|uniref:hypothetical protein n=1 Tax=Halococcus agarilyticus TaxID=1232219 RepID=UPI0006782E76|nr:hypothetical protein [Halococcus agarilyticus]